MMEFYAVLDQVVELLRHQPGTPQAALDCAYRHGLGRLYGQTGHGEQARIELATAIDLYRAMDMTFWLPQAEAALAQME